MQFFSPIQKCTVQSLWPQHFAADVDAQTQSKNTKSMLTVLGGGEGGGGNYVENLELWKARWSYKAPATPTREADLSARISTDFPSS